MLQPPNYVQKAVDDVIAHFPSYPIRLIVEDRSNDDVLLINGKLDGVCLFCYASAYGFGIAIDENLEQARDFNLCDFSYQVEGNFALVSSRFLYSMLCYAIQFWIASNKEATKELQKGQENV